MITSSTCHYWKCGCYYETSLDENGEVCLIQASTCGVCFDACFRKLDEMVLDKKAQLTLGLASPERERNQDVHESHQAQT